MSLTIGPGPFAARPGGVLNARLEHPGHVLWFEDSPRRVRGVVAGETVVDSTRAKLLHETALLPVYYFPEEDVRSDLLRPSDRRTTCPFKGEAGYYSIAVGDDVRRDAVWTYPEPIEGAPPLAGHLAFYWGKVDHWYEEDEEVFGHARDPYHRIDAIPTSREVVIGLDGVALARSTRAVVLFETGLPPRWYLPPEDVTADLVPSERTSRCTYKGVATYRSVRLDDRVEEDLVWCYPEPAAAVAAIAGRLAFFDERVDVEVDGERAERPKTQWSAGRFAAPLPR